MVSPFPWRVLSTSWCCPSRPCVAFLACVHLALFLALSLSRGKSLVSSWCDHSMLPSLLWRVSNSSLFTPTLLRIHSFVFFAVCFLLLVYLQNVIGRRRFVLMVTVLRRYSGHSEVDPGECMQRWCDLACLCSLNSIRSAVTYSDHRQVVHTRVLLFSEIQTV